jgi:hypothetical protein
LKRYPSKPFLHARIVTLVLACLPGAVCAQNSPLFLPPYTPWPDFAVSVVQPGDVNNDGRVDLVGISDSTPTILNVMLQSNDGSFAPPMHVNLSNVPAVTIDDLQVVDLDGDGP